jgi:hypothetical protein
MNTEWFDPVVQNWSDSSAVRAKMREVLLDISRVSGGEPVDDGSAALNEADRREWAVTTALDAVQARLNLLARNLVDLRPDRRFLDKTGPRGPYEHPDLERATWRRATALNTASVAELDALPILGSVLAQRIVNHRLSNGPFSRLEELSRIPGLTAEAVNALRDVLALDADPLIYPRVSELDDFIAEPSFERLAAFVRRTGASFLEASSEVLDADETLLRELKGVFERMTAVPPPTARYNRRTSTAVREQLALRRRSSAMVDTVSKDVTGVAAIRDGEYMGFARTLMEKAVSTIQIVMFFMRYERTRSTPLNQLIDSLVEAHRRGVAVQVLLDADKPDDPAMSRVVNSATFQRLKESGVAVRLDSPERSTHSKLVVVDGRKIIVGSHNWTLASMLRYDDTSIYLEAKSLGAAYERRFKLLWEAA